MSQPKPIIYLDMDGVLADFVSPTLALFNRLDLIDSGWPKGEYSLEKVLGITTEQLWWAIDMVGVDFWAQLPIYPWALRLYRALELYGDVYLLSAPSSSPHSHAGKRLWMQQHFGESFNKYVLTRHKHLLSGENRFLIDDHDLNCSKFASAGGAAVVFPQPWNEATAGDVSRPELGVLETIAGLVDGDW